MPISEVYKINNRKALKEFNANAFNWAIDDPPYFNGPNTRLYYGHEISPINVRRRDYGLISSWKIPGKTYFDTLKNISHNQIVWGCNYFKYPFGPGRIIWDKVNGQSSFSDCEIAYCSAHDSVRLFRYMWNGMMQGKSIEEGHLMQGNKKLNEIRIHPTQKPVLLYKWQLSRYVKPGQKVLDPHSGSQSLRIACWDMNIDYIGFEIDDEMFEKGNRRFALHIQQQKLFI